MTMRGRFEIDRENGKLMGVCAGLANHSGVDVTIIRVGLVLVTILGAFPWTLIAYGIAAIAGKPKPRQGFSLDRFAKRERTAEQARERMRDIDRRMQDIETYVTSSNSRLAREIEELR